MENGFLCNRKRENKNGKMVGNIKGILGNINGSNRIILYKYNMYPYKK